MSAPGPSTIGPATGELRSFALFADAEAAVLERVRRRMRLRVAPQGVEIVAQGSADAPEVYFILSGRVDVRGRAADGSAVWLASLGPGEIFGELQAIDGVPRSGDVVAVETCRLAVMGAAAFVETVAGDPDLARRMMRILVERLRRLDLLFVERSAVDLAGRVGREILRRARLADDRILSLKHI
jgi:CRP-like cAMP-binding protein